MGKVTQLRFGKKDPTRSVTLRKAFQRDIRRGYKRLTGAIKYLVSTKLALTTNAIFRFEDNPGKLKRFREWLRQQMDSTLAGDALLEEYVRRAYTKGASRAFNDATRQVFSTLSGGESSVVGAHFLVDLFNQVRTLQSVKLLASRTFSELDGVNQRMSAALSRILADGLVHNHSTTEIAERMIKEVGIASNRAQSIARNEVVRAHAEGQLDAMERMGITHVGAAVEWDTTGDEKVCKLCKPLDGIVLTVKEARGMLPRHPGCRCAWIPAVLPYVTAGKKKNSYRRGQKTQKREIQRAISRSQKQGHDATTWHPNTEIQDRSRKT